MTRYICKREKWGKSVLALQKKLSGIFMSVSLQWKNNTLFTAETDNCLCYPRVIFQDLRAHHVPTVTSAPRQSVSVQVTPSLRGGYPGAKRRQKGSVCVHPLTDPSLAFLIHFKFYFGSFLRADYCVTSGDSGKHPNASYLREPWNHPWLEASKIYKRFIFVYPSKKRKKIPTYILYIHIKGSGQIHSNYWLWIVEGTPLFLLYKRFIVWIFKVMSIAFLKIPF